MSFRKMYYRSFDRAICSFPYYVYTAYLSHTFPVFCCLMLWCVFFTIITTTAAAAATSSYSYASLIASFLLYHIRFLFSLSLFRPFSAIINWFGESINIIYRYIDKYVCLAYIYISVWKKNLSVYMCIQKK